MKTISDLLNYLSFNAEIPSWRKFDLLLGLIIIQGIIKQILLQLF